MFAALVLATVVAVDSEPVAAPVAPPAPVAAGAAPPAPVAAGAAPPAAPSQALHVIGHVKAVTAFCSAFERHFNGAAHPLIDNDASVGSLGFTMGTLEPHFRQLGSENFIYEDRVHMMSYIASMQKLIPQAQSEINDLRNSAKLTSDPDAAADAFDLAQNLQTALDKQKQIAIDTSGVVQALNEMTVSPAILNQEDITSVTSPGQLNALVGSLSRTDPFDVLGAATNNAYPRASTEIETRRDAEDYATHTPAARRDVRSYLKWQSQLEKLGNAENAAAVKANALNDRCN